MSRRLSFLFIASLFTPASFAVVRPANTVIVPEKGKKISFVRNYDATYLKNHPLQLVKKSNFTLSNTGGLITSKWKATLRDIRTDESVEAEATGICRARGTGKVECAFEAETGTAVITANKKGVLISIPPGQGVRFNKPSAEGPVWAELLIGTDEDNNLFEVYPKKPSN